MGTTTTTEVKEEEKNGTGNGNENENENETNGNRENENSSPPHHISIPLNMSMSQIEIHQYIEKPTFKQLTIRIVTSIVPCLVAAVYISSFKPYNIYEFIWPMALVGLAISSANSVAYGCLLLKVDWSKRFIFSTALVWVGAPVLWTILQETGVFPQPGNLLVTTVIPLDIIWLGIAYILIKKEVQSRSKNYKKRWLAFLFAFFVNYVYAELGSEYYKLYIESGPKWRIALPIIYTVVMRVIQWALDILCYRCAKGTSNLIIIVGRIIFSLYSYLVLAYAQSYVHIIPVILSKFGLNLGFAILVHFPRIQPFLLSLLPIKCRSFIESNFMENNNNNNTNNNNSNNNLSLNNISSNNNNINNNNNNGSNNNLSRPKLQYTKSTLKLQVPSSQHAGQERKATELWFSMFSDWFALVLLIILNLLGRYNRGNETYCTEYNFQGNQQFYQFLGYLGVCLITTTVYYIIIWTSVIWKTSSTTNSQIIDNIILRISINWFPNQHFIISIINMMLIVVMYYVALVPIFSSDQITKGNGYCN
ncbi:hypothetical protein DFA_11271 [Cavenderia fasciculata]|uniref:Transmembrane protein n=1 Tax=Cavenderia fasciculata TaxID=261658 RepID=F4QC23_CACFS|nr:uncharacterized protein DFA_11271 [Cavenderia fasciculata]EGG13510.1 hypothetical protein DFA_11271 [Cavenderia fasciculata]|eukprot:XP_004350214.1 hypothetical protein DFA_11271 [Cavenderia fasciculata]